MDTISGGSWIMISDGCPLQAITSGPDEGCLIFGRSPHEHELTFTMAALRDFVAKGAAILAHMDTLAIEERASREARSAS